MIEKGKLPDMGELLGAGERFEFSELGRMRSPRTTAQTGTVIHPNKDGNSYIVLLDGRKTKTTIHHTYIQKLKEPKRSK